MDHLDTLIARQLTPAEWLSYYQNVWTRNVVARSIDVNTDQALKAKYLAAKAKDPNAPKEMVEFEGKYIPVEERLELRKIAVQDALDILAGIERLQATDLNGKTFREVFCTAEYLQVDADMLPKEPKAGDVCDLDDKSGKGVLGEVDGKLVCVKPETPAAPAGAPEEGAKV